MKPRKALDLHGDRKACLPMYILPEDAQADLFYTAVHFGYYSLSEAAIIKPFRYMWE